MDLNDYLDIKLKDFYTDFEIYNTITARDGTVSLRFKNRIIQAQLLTPITKGIIKIIKSGDKYFVLQTEGNRDKTVYTVVKQEKQVYKHKEEESPVSYIIFVLCDKERTDVEQKSITEVKNLVNIQIVEDIVIIDKSRRFSKIKLEDLRIDKDPAKVKEPYLSFFSFLQNATGLNVIKNNKYTSFYNFLVNSKVKKEQLTLANFELDDVEVSRKKLKLFDYEFLFDNAAIYQNFNIRTAVRKTDKYSPYNLINLNGERPNKKAEFKEQLVTFYSQVKEDVPKVNLQWTYFLPKTKNLGVINNVFPNLNNYSYPMQIEVLTRNDALLQITFLQSKFPDIRFAPIPLINYETVLVGFIGIIRKLDEGTYFHPLGDISVKVISVNLITKKIGVEGISNAKIQDEIQIENIDSVKVNDIGVISGKKGKSIFLKY